MLCKFLTGSFSLCCFVLRLKYHASMFCNWVTLWELYVSGISVFLWIHSPFIFVKQDFRLKKGIACKFQFNIFETEFSIDSINKARKTTKLEAKFLQHKFLHKREFFEWYLLGWTSPFTKYDFRNLEVVQKLVYAIFTGWFLLNSRMNYH